MINVRILYCLFLLAGTAFVSCKKKDHPPTVPVLTTVVASNTTASTASSGGTITSDGGSPISYSGICWSKTNPMPTLSDDTTVGTTASGSFVAQLKGLDPSATYYIRAYALNAIGIGYGNVVSFMTDNAAPTATAVMVTGDAEVNKTLTAAYTYHDAENDPEGMSLYQWYEATDGTGSGETAIVGANGLNYTIQGEQQGKYIRFGVTPKATVGNLDGTAVKSSFGSAVGEATTVTFTYNGGSVTYGILVSAKTQKRWLDRNLGAAAVATAFDDYAHAGDLFQWGRGDDGHQLIVRTGSLDANASGSPTTTTLATTNTPGNNQFIISTLGLNDWRNPKNDELWQGVDGANNPCPTGWRLPTQAEWEAEAISNLSDGFTKLKLTRSGRRAADTGDFFQSTSAGNYWTSTANVSPAGYSMFMYLGAGISFVDYDLRADGKAVRCIK